MENFTQIGNFLLAIVVDVRTPLWVLVVLELGKLFSYRFQLPLPRSSALKPGPEYAGDELIVRDNHGNFYGFRHPGSPDLAELKNFGFTIERKK